jgi:D-glycero-D-manno-heptose 1,7-bisphosphate phosphatase
VARVRANIDGVKTWTLFLDRDGVLNRRVPDGYVRQVDELVMLDGVVEAVAELSAHSRRVVVVTNQAGVGKGLMTAADLDAVHARLEHHLAVAGGRVDAVLHCPHRVEDACGCRKPAPGLAWEAVRRFPDIDLGRSVMVGDSVSDCEFARVVGMRAVFIGDRSVSREIPVWQVADSLASAVPLLLELLATGRG